MSTQQELPPSGFVTRLWLKNYLSISFATMHQWIADGRLPAPLKIGPRAVRFRAEDIRAWLARGDR